MEPNNLKFSTAEKGKECLVLNDCKYRLVRILKSGERSWRCTIRNCPGVIRTTVDNRLSMEPTTHSHGQYTKQQLVL